ncbi:MAG: hypothetical protein Kow00124_14820 [Anaerolineae bacterium]
MDFGRLLNRTWDIVWGNKWLIILGILIALTTGNSFNPNTSIGGGGTPDGQYQYDEYEYDYDPGRDGFSPEEMQRFFTEVFPFVGLAGALLIPLICVGMLIGVALWVLGVTARGALINAVDLIDGGGTSTLGDSMRAAWAKVMRLVGIGLVPAIPVVVLFLAAAVLSATFMGLRGFNSMAWEQMFSPGLTITLVAVLCVAGLLSFVLGLLRTFAERAVMIEDQRVFEAYSRGWQVLRSNLGAALLVFIIQVGISIVLGLVLLGPTLCCIFWPILLVINGGIVAYFSTLWTLAWREWTSRGQSGEPAPAV